MKGENAGVAPRLPSDQLDAKRTYDSDSVIAPSMTNSGMLSRNQVVSQFESPAISS